MRRGLLRASTLILLTGCCAAADLPKVATGPGSRPDTYVGRLEALALLETLNAELLSHDSATLTLEHWCAEHRLAVPARVVAARMTGVDKPPSAEQRHELQVSDSEPVRYRRVRLSCGTAVLSEADNWYVPGRLTAEMNSQLDTTDTPFGKVVQALNFRRHTFAAELLWHPLPEGWEMGMRRPLPTGVGTPGAKGVALIVPQAVLQHRALLTLPDGTPVSEVVETYSSSVLDFKSQSSPN